MRRPRSRRSRCLPILITTLVLPCLGELARSQSEWIAHRGHYRAILPPGLTGAAHLAFDDARRRLVMTTYNRGLYEFDGSRVARRATLPTSPRTVAWFPPLRRTLVLDDHQMLAWDGRELQIVPGAPQGIRLAAFDSQRGVLVALGPGGTWEYDGVSWQSINTPFPIPITQGRSMAYDPQLGVVLLLSRVHPISALQSWQYGPSGWQQHAISTAQLPTEATLVFHPGRGRVVAFGSGQAVEWDGSDWTPWPAAAFAGGLAAVTFDPDRGRLVTIAAWPAPLEVHDSLREFDGAAWVTAVAPPFPPPIPGERHGVYDGSRDRFVRVLFPAGNAPARVDEWDGAAWHHPAPPVAPPARIETACTYDPAGQRLVLFGGQRPNGSWLGDLWSWDGTAWQQHAGGPPPRSRAGLAFDTGAARLALVGGIGPGYAALSDHWEWDGAQWQQLAVSSPAFVAPRTMVCDPVRAVLVLGVGTLHWEFENGAWSLRGALPYGAPELAVDTLAGRVIMKGALHMFEWTGSAWTIRQTMTSNFPSTGIAFDSRRGVVLAEGPALMTWTDHAARTAEFGTGCGAFGRVPALAAFGEPVLGESGFGLDVAGAAPNSLCIAALAFGALPGNSGGCQLLLPAVVAAPVGVTNAGGFAHFPLPLPNWPSLRGVELFGQAFVLDGLAPNGISLTQGLRLVLGD